MLCAGQQPFPPAQVWPALPPIDACSGDSGEDDPSNQSAALHDTQGHAAPFCAAGGPLLVLGGSEGEDVQHGIVSFGVGCALPGVPGALARWDGFAGVDRTAAGR